jgi:hypothetical protein
MEFDFILIAFTTMTSMSVTGIRAQMTSSAACIRCTYTGTGTASVVSSTTDMPFHLKFIQVGNRLLI